MATLLVNEDQTQTRDNDFFTSTVVGLPCEVTLGKAFSARKLKDTPSIMLDAVTSTSWLSDPARLMLKQQVKQSPKTIGLPYPAGNFGYRRTFNSTIVAFLLGFALCATFGYLYLTQPFVRQWIHQYF